MPTTSSLEYIQLMYIGYYGRPADPGGLTHWAGRLDAAGYTADDWANNIPFPAEVLGEFSNSPEFNARFAGLSDAELIEGIYLQAFGRVPDQEGFNFFLEGLTSGNTNLGLIAFEIINGVTGDPDATTLANKRAVADAFTAAVAAEGKEFFNEDVPALRALLDEVVFESNPADFTARVNQIVASLGDATDPEEPEVPVVPGVVRNLTVDQDIIEGTDGNDVFNARIFDNQNTFQSGDFIDGGLGFDTLNVTLGVSSGFAIRAETSNIEVVNITSQARNATGNTGNNEVRQEVNVIDAELMEGVQQWWNNNSRGDLVIEDVRSTSASTTIGWRNTDPGSVDYAVYFDNQYITNAGSAQGLSTLEIRMVNAFSLADQNQPLVGFIELLFTVGDQEVLVDIRNSTSYTEIVNKINAQLQAQGITGVNVIPQAARTALFTDDVGIYQQGQVAGTYTPILLTSNSQQLTRGPINVDNNTENANFLNTMTDVSGPEAPSLTQTNVVLDNVGRDSKAGTLEIGAMSQTEYSNSAGIQQFNIDVVRSSWLEEIRSTNNSLEALHIENVAIGSNVFTTTKSARGDLRVDYLKDVRIVEASEMTGSLRLSRVELTDDIVEKYLDLKDINANPANDNSDSVAWANPNGGTFAKDFNYTTGAGDDHIEMFISANNTAVTGTANREDFALTINTGEGNDYVRLSLVNFVEDANGNIETELAESGDVWFANHAINAGNTNQQIVINAGNGDNVVWAEGAGNFRITTGTGNDAIYSDNSGDKSVFVFNTANQANPTTVEAARNIENLQSASAVLTAAGNAPLVAAKTTLTVDFRGYQVTVAIPTQNFQITDLSINQAIKNAINNDAVLKNLFEAKDGPGRTLVVESLIDGVIAPAQLAVTVNAPATASFTAAEITAITAATGLTGIATEADLIAAINASITAVTAGGRFTTAYANDGDDTTPAVIAGDVAVNSQSNNIINSGSGLDTIVLGTEINSNETVVMNTGFGHNVIVNFDATAGAGADRLDFGGNADNWGAVNAYVNNTTAILDDSVTIVGFSALTGVTGTFTGLNSLTLAQLNSNFNFGPAAVAPTPGNPATEQNFLILVEDTGTTAITGAGSSSYKVFNVTSDTSTQDATGVDFMGQVTLVGVTSADLIANNDSII